jgi:hypothetical protein
MRPFILAVLFAFVELGCNSNGTPEDCTAAGGRCVVGTAPCAKQGPDDTCANGSTPAGGFCCITFIGDAGDSS